MIKFIYIVYGAIVVLLTTCTNLSYVTSPGSSSSWGSRGGSSSYGGGAGGYSGGSHK